MVTWLFRHCCLADRNTIHYFAKPKSQPLPGCAILCVPCSSIPRLASSPPPTRAHPLYSPSIPWRRCFADHHLHRRPFLATTYRQHHHLIRRRFASQANHLAFTLDLVSLPCRHSRLARLTPRSLTTIRPHLHIHPKAPFSRTRSLR